MARCEFRDQIQQHFARREVVMQPSFRTEREDWVQRVVADGHAICILPERSAAAPGLVTRPIEGLSLERELVIATVSGSTTLVEIRKIVQLASKYEWQWGPPQQCPAAMETILAAYWKTSSRDPISKDDACTLRANSNALGSQTKYWVLIMQYGKSQEAIDPLTAEQRRVTQEGGTERPFTEEYNDHTEPGIYVDKVVTEVTPVGDFWEAEPEHQDYLERYPNGYTCHFPRPNWVLPKRETAGESTATPAHTGVYARS